MPLIVTSPQTLYLCPGERDAVLAEILTLLQSAQHSVRVMLFQLSQPAMVAALGDASNRGCDVRVILDKTEGGTGVELIQIHALMLHVPPANIRLGTSPVKKRFMHSKLVSIDGHTVIGGSLNWSSSGLEESQSVTITAHPDYAAYVEAEFDSLWAWITTNEAAYQNLTT